MRGTFLIGIFLQAAYIFAAPQSLFNKKNLQSGEKVDEFIKQLPAPYSHISNFFPYRDTGYYSNDESMKRMIEKFQPKVVVELGSWLGESTWHIAAELPEDGVVYAVDHWLGSDEHHISKSKVTRKILPDLYERFLSNIIHMGQTEKIIPCRMTTREGKDFIIKNKILVDMVYVDASHKEEDVYTDLCDWYPLIEGHGVICGDDWEWANPIYSGFPVKQAVKRFAKENNLGIRVEGDSFWYLYPNDE